MRLKASFGALSLLSLLALTNGSWSRLTDDGWYLPDRFRANTDIVNRCASPTKLVEQIKHYEFVGADAREADRAFRRALLFSVDYSGQRRRFAGRTDWHIEWQPCHEPIGTGCRITGVALTAHATYTLPRWANRDLTNKRLSARWDRYIKSLYEHERGHGRIALRVANHIERDLVGLANFSDCSALQIEAAQRVATVMRQGEAMQNAYDRTTGHGTKQGAVFPF